MANKTAVVQRIVGDTLAYAISEDGQRQFSFTPQSLVSFGGQDFADSNIKVGVAVNFEWDPVTTEATDIRLDTSTLAVPTDTYMLDDRLESIHLTGNIADRDRRFRGGARFSSVEADKPPVPTRKDDWQDLLSLADQSSPFLGLDDHAIQALQSALPRSTPYQRELHPAAAPVGEVRVSRGLPSSTRKFGKLIHVEALRPGDLLLTRDIQPDSVSQLISAVQSAGGYSIKDSQWTHAAMYVGDEACVVEATFDSVLRGGNVRLTTLDQLCQGSQILRFRRPRLITDERTGWKVCVRALSKLKVQYSFVDCVKMWFHVRVLQHDLFDADQKRDASSAVICSTLYADAFNEAMRQTLGEINGVCVPAWLSLSDEFDDVAVDWAKIV